MRYIALMALMITTSAYAEEPKPAEPAKTETPANPTAWIWSDMEISDLNTLNACANELPKRIADPFIQRLQAHVKPVTK
jgi:hypothetical protein